MKNLNLIKKISLSLILILTLFNTLWLTEAGIRIPSPFNFFLYWGSILLVVTYIFLISQSQCRIFNKYSLRIGGGCIIALLLSIYLQSKFHENLTLGYITDIFIFTSVTTLLLIGYNTFDNQYIRRQKQTQDINSRFYTAILICILIVALVLRIYNLDFLPPAVDEYYNLLAAKKNFLTGSFGYPRSVFLTELLTVIYKYFGSNIFLSRLPGVLLGVISTFLMSIIGSRISKQVGLISAYLFSVSPLAVGMARYIRDYEYLIFFFLLAIVSTLILNDFIKNVKLTKLYKPLFFLIVNIVLAFYFLLDTQSGGILITWEAEVILLVILNMQRIWITFLSLKQFYKVLLMLTLGVLTLAVVYFILTDYSWLINSFNINTDYINMLFNPIYGGSSFRLMWYPAIPLIPSALFILFSIVPLTIEKNRITIIAFYLMLLLSLLPFVLLSDRYFGARYIYFAIPIFILILSIAISKVLEIVLTLPIKHYIKYACVLVLFILFSPFNVIQGLLTEDPNYLDPKTGISHYDHKVLFDTLYNLGYKPGDKVITTRSDMFGYWMNEYTFINKEDTESYPLKRFMYKDNGEFWYDYTTVDHYYYISSDNGYGTEYSTPYLGEECLDKVCTLNEKERITKVMKKIGSGWMIIDKDRNTKWNSNGFPLKDSYTAHNIIHYLLSTEGEKGFDIYYWEPISN